MHCYTPSLGLRGRTSLIYYSACCELVYKTRDINGSKFTFIRTILDLVRSNERVSTLFELVRCSDFDAKSAYDKCISSCSSGYFVRRSFYDQVYLAVLACARRNTPKSVILVTSLYLTNYLLAFLSKD